MTRDDALNKCRVIHPHCFKSRHPNYIALATQRTTIYLNCAKLYMHKNYPPLVKAKLPDYVYGKSIEDLLTKIQLLGWLET